MHLGDKTILKVGEKAFCWIYMDGRARQIEVETGVSDGEWIEVTNHRVPSFGSSSAGRSIVDAIRRQGTGDPRRSCRFMRMVVP